MKSTTFDKPSKKKESHWIAITLNFDNCEFSDIEIEIKELIILTCGSNSQRRRGSFPFRKRSMPFLTVDAIISNQAFSYERRKMFPGFSYKRQKIRFRIQLESPR